MPQRCRVPRHYHFFKTKKHQNTSTLFSEFYKILSPSLDQSFLEPHKLDPLISSLAQGGKAVAESGENVSTSQAYCLLCVVSDKYKLLSEKNAWNFVGLGLDASLCVLHNAPQEHPEKPARLKCIIEMLKAEGYCHKCTFTGTRHANLEEILIAHTKNYWNYLTLKSSLLQTNNVVLQNHNNHALSSRDDLYYDATTASAVKSSLGTALQLIDSIMDNKCPVKRGFALIRPPGHHACPDTAMGFCFLNNVAICAKTLRTKYQLRRILIVDFDVHHGNGIQKFFYKDPNFLYFSIHRYDQATFFPGTGGKEEIGIAAGKGYTINVPLNCGYGDTDVYIAVRDLLFPAVEVFQPQFVIVAAGFDAMAGDPLGLCNMTTDGYHWLTRQLLRIAERYSKGRLAMILEGGYSPKNLAEGVRSCIKALGEYYCEELTSQKTLLNSDHGNEEYNNDNTTFFVERFKDIETIASLTNDPYDRDTETMQSENLLLNPFIDENTWNNNNNTSQILPVSIYWTNSSTITFILNTQYDFLSQLHSVFNIQSKNTNISKALTFALKFLVLPCVVCSKPTYSIIQQIAKIHSKFLITKPLTYSRPYRIRKYTVTPPLGCRNIIHLDKEHNNVLSKLSHDEITTQTPVSDSPRRLSVSTKKIQNSNNASCLITSSWLGPVESFPTVGGHDDQWLQSPNTLPGYILKRTTHSEAMFYVWIASSPLPNIRPVTYNIKEIANFLDSIPMLASKDERQAFKNLIPKCRAVDIGHNIPHQRNCFVEMENLLLGLQKPCILDMKIGPRMYGDDASEEKKLKMQQKAKNSTAHQYGVKITAFKAWNAEKSLIVETTRMDASQFKTFKELELAIFSYLNAALPSHRYLLAKSFQHEIEKIQKVFVSQCVAHFYSSSLLFVYDSVPFNDTKPSSTSIVKMIDFAHVTLNPKVPDYGYQKGLQTLLIILDDYLRFLDNIE